MPIAASSLSRVIPPLATFSKTPGDLSQRRTGFVHIQDVSDNEALFMKLESQSDEWLMGQVARGDRACLEILIERFSSPMLTYLRRFLGDTHNADEVFQEVFLSVWAKRRQYKFPLTFRSWLFAIAANKAREHFRRRSRRPAGAELVDVADNESGPMNDAIKAEHATEVNRALQSLTEQQRSVVILRVWNGLSYAEIATSIGAKEGTARALMHRALEKLRPTLSRLAEQ